MDDHLADTRPAIPVIEDQPADRLILGEAVGDLAAARPPVLRPPGGEC